MLLLSSEERIFAMISIKKGLTISIGWNLGKNNNSIHLFDPFTSKPKKGTSNNKIKVKKKIYGKKFFIKSLLGNEIKKTKFNASKTKAKCFKKK